jgi:hypothetical protein
MTTKLLRLVAKISGKPAPKSEAAVPASSSAPKKVVCTLTPPPDFEEDEHDAGYRN